MNEPEAELHLLLRSLSMDGRRTAVYMCFDSLVTTVHRILMFQVNAALYYAV